jgi:DNA-binding MltR family transcriptional regulator
VTHWDDDDAELEDYVITGKALERYFDLHAALIEFSRLFDYEEENDRAIAIVGGTFLETLLEHVLVAFVVDDQKEVAKLLEYNQPLGTYSGRTTMAYCLGLINKPVLDDLRLVGKIRNQFAHNLYASFNDEKIAAWCRELKWHKISLMSQPPLGASNRALFQVGVNQLVTYLHAAVK